MKKLFCAFVLSALVLPVQGAYLVRIPDLQRSPTPPNPVRVYGWVTSESPLTLAYGGGEITVVGVTAAVSDFLVVTGDWDGSVLTVSGDVTAFVGPAAVEMVYIPAGSFLMGNNGGEPYSYDDELPQHDVYLSGYWIGKYEVTRGEYRMFMEAGGYSNPAYWSTDGWDWKVSNNRVEPGYWAALTCFYHVPGACDPSACSYAFTQTDDHPVVGVTYYEAQACCAWAEGRLPVEAEWEKAARWTGSYPNVYPWGNVWDAEQCNNFNDHALAGGGYQRYQTAPVGSYPSGVSPYGLHDVAGNVWEWCLDWYSDSYYSLSPPLDPQGPAGGSYRVHRGGSLLSGRSGNNNRCAFRNIHGVPSSTNYYVGFRLAR